MPDSSVDLIVVELEGIRDAVQARRLASEDADERQRLAEHDADQKAKHRC